jgi:hypothetical protein
MMQNNKPFHWTKNYRSNKDMVDYKWRERKTDISTFNTGHTLPFDTGNPNLNYTLQDPKDYDLIYHSEQPPEIFLNRYDILPSNGTAPLVNLKVKKLLEEFCPNDVQFFPATIVPEKSNMESFENHDYWALNICSIYNDINFEDSVFTYGARGGGLEKHIMGYKKCVFHELRGQTIPHIGRLIHALSYIIVSPELVKLFKGKKIKGVKFYSEEDYPFM